LADAATWIIRADGTGDFPTIQAGLTGAVAGDTLELADGTYSGPGNRDLNPAGKDLVVRSQSGAPTACVIDGQSIRGLILVSGESASFVVSDLGFMHCENLGGGGGAIVCVLSSPTIRGCRFEMNRAGADGGAIHAEGNGAKPTIMNCVFINNQCTDGGAIGVYDAGPINIQGCHFEENYASSGGAISVSGQIAVTVSNCSFFSNTATYGGAISCAGTSSTSAIDCVFTENLAFSEGGAISVRHLASATVSASTIAGNVAVGKGGALLLDVGPVVVADCVIAGNYADGRGGALSCGGNGTVSVTSSTLAGNHGRLFGGGLYGELGAVVVFDQSVVFENCAIVGADVFLSGAAVADFRCSAMDTTKHESGGGVVVYGPDNVFSDPLFCGPESCEMAPTTAGTYNVAIDSPCLSQNSPCGLLIGALGEGCGGAVSVGPTLESASWGRIKSNYR